MKTRMILSLLVMMTMSACTTPWYRLQRENESLKTEVEELRIQVGDMESTVMTSEEARLQAERNYASLKAENDKLQKSLMDKLKGTGANVSIRNGRPVIVLPNSIFFDAGNHSIKKKSKGSMRKVAEILAKDYDDFFISIEGHTDSDPIRASKKRYSDNYQLASERARSVLHFLHNEGGVKLSRMQGVFHGPNMPVSPNKTKSGKSKNRRVEIVLMALK